MAQKTRAQLDALIAANLPNNVSQLITPAKHREVEEDLTDSNVNVLDDVIETSAGAGSAGKLVKLAGDGKFDASTLPAGGGAAWGGITGTLSAQTDLQDALDLLAPLDSPQITGSPFFDLAAGGMGVNADGVQVLNIDETGVQFRRPLIENPTTIGNGDSPIIAITDLLVNGTRTDGTPLVLPPIGSASSGQHLAIAHTGTGAQPIDADAAGEIYDGSSGAVDSISLAVGETVVFRALGNKWRVLVRYVIPDLSAALALKLDVLHPPSAMGALVMDVTQQNNTKTISADSTLTRSATPASGQSWGITITNSDGDNHVITLSPGAYSLDFKASRTTFTLLAGTTATIMFFRLGTTDYMHGDPILASDIAALPEISGELFIMSQQDIPFTATLPVLKAALDIPDGDAVYNDTDRTTTTLSNLMAVTGVKANRLVNFRAQIPLTVSAVGSAKFSVAFTGAATGLFAYQLSAFNVATGATIQITRQATEGGSVSITAGATSMFVTIEGSLFSDGDGTLEIKFAQVVANGTTTALLGGSLATWAITP